MGKKKSKFYQSSLFSYPNKPTETNSAPILKLVLKSSVRYHNDINFLIELSGKLIYNF